MIILFIYTNSLAILYEEISQLVVNPSSTKSECPVIISLLLDSKNMTALTTSSTSANLCNGTLLSKGAFLTGSDQNFFPMSVQTTVGFTEFT